MKLNRKIKTVNSQEWQCYLILAIPIIGFLLFTLYPYIWAGRWGFFDYRGIVKEAKFVGLKNFKDIFSEQGQVYWKAWLFTIKFALLKTPVEIPLALFLAYILSKAKLKGIGFFRAVFYLPNMISVAIIGLVFSNLFNYFGAINAMLAKLNITDTMVDWFSNESTSLAVLLISSIWKGFGVNILYLMAALSNIDMAIYEAADIDGAGRFTKFFRITVPMIAPMMQTILLLSINGTLHMGEFVVVLSNGAPGGATHTVGSYIIKEFVPGFVQATPNIGYGSALSIVTSIIYCIIAICYMKMTRKMSNVY